MNIDRPTGIDLAQPDNDAAHAIALPPALELDPAKYMAEIDDFGMTEAQKRELIEILWSIMRTCVDLGFGFDVCAQLLPEFNIAAEVPPDGVVSSEPITTETERKDSGEEDS